MMTESKSLLPPERNNSEPVSFIALHLFADLRVFHSKSKELISDSDEEME